VFGEGWSTPIENLTPHLTRTTVRKCRYKVKEWVAGLAAARPEDIHGHPIEQQVGRRAALQGALPPRPPPGAYMLGAYETADYGELEPSSLPTAVSSRNDAAAAGGDSDAAAEPIQGVIQRRHLPLTVQPDSDGVVLADAVPDCLLYPMLPPPPKQSEGATLSGQGVQGTLPSRFEQSGRLAEQMPAQDWPGAGASVTPQQRYAYDAALEEALPPHLRLPMQRAAPPTAVMPARNISPPTFSSDNTVVGISFRPDDADSHGVFTVAKPTEDSEREEASKGRPPTHGFALV
jgi:hypothetical protein